MRLSHWGLVSFPYSHFRVLTESRHCDTRGDRRLHRCWTECTPEFVTDLRYCAIRGTLGGVAIHGLSHRHQLLQLVPVYRHGVVDVRDPKAACAYVASSVMAEYPA
jgi:hypothetical protein